MSAEPPLRDIETALLDAIHQFFAERATEPVRPAGHDEPLASRPLQLATTVLFLQMIAADHEARHDEHQALAAAIGRVLGIESHEAATIIRLGEEHVKTPLPALLRLLNERCSHAQKKRVVEGMWQLAFSDAELAGHEEYFVRKVTQALDLGTADLIETKIVARERFLRG